MFLGEESQVLHALDEIARTISEDPQSSTCPNITYQDYRGPVASANPTGSPYAGAPGHNRMEGMDASGSGSSHMMSQQHPGQSMMSGGGGMMMTQNNMPMMSSTPMASGGNNMLGNPSVFSNIGNGMHNLNIGSGANMVGGANGGAMMGGNMAAVEGMRNTLRGSGFADHAVEEIINAVVVLSNYGLFGFSLNLGSLGLQQNQPHPQSQQGVMGGVMGTPHQGHMGGHPSSHQGMINPSALRGAGDATPQMFGPMGGSNNSKAGGDSGDGSFYGSAGNDPRMMGGNGAGGDGPWNTSFNQSGSMQSNFTPGPVTSLNQNSFGLGTGMGGGDGDMSMVGDDRVTTREMEVGEYIVGAILGQGGKGIIEIQNMTGTNIQISKKGVFAPGTRNRLVTINGPTRGVLHAESMIQQRIQNEERSRVASRQ